MEWKQIKTVFSTKSGKHGRNSDIHPTTLTTEWGKGLIQDIQREKSLHKEKNRKHHGDISGEKGAGNGSGTVRILTEYPRPQMVRLKPAGRYEILNGWWRYAIVDSRRVPEIWDGEILVPFSPETRLSFVKRKLQPEEYLWYEKEIQVKDFPENQRVLLHFGAVDQKCDIYLNGRKLASHVGGYLPFSVEVTGRICSGRNVIHLCVRDLSDTSYLTRGKQTLNPGGMFYTAQSGIWQTVWMEWVPMHYVERLWITPLYDNDMVDILIRINGPACNRQVGISETAREMVEVKLYEPVINLDYQSDGACCFCNAGRQVLRELKVETETVQLDAVHRECHVKIHVPDKKSWTPETPWLYGLSIATGEDHLASYMAMRCFTVEKDEKDNPRICLNHKPYFMNGVLDQGYWPESLMTPPADAALVSDIMKMKQMGFNMIRKHCKIEVERWYYHCDRFGMLVWQDMVNGGSTYNMMKLCYLPTALPALFASRKDHGTKDYKRTGRKHREGRLMWQKETRETVDFLYNHPSISTWVLFNEGWGQFDSGKAYESVKKQDGTRLIDHASGWFDQKQGDMRSVHNYFRPLKVEKDIRPFVLSEYGGYAWQVENHTWSTKLYGYGAYRKQEKLQEAYDALKKQISTLAEEGLSAAVYTQLSDIEEEANGILTYDREICKIQNESAESCK